MLPPSKRMATTPYEWLAHATSDLKLAKLGLNQDILPEQVCFHAQQAAEKALKAVLLHAGVDFPFTHDLEELLDTCADAAIVVPQELQEAGSLTPYAVETRYPGFWGEISDADVQEALTCAERAVAWANGRIGGK
jgi:HEPN domain-containing protein